MEILWKESAWLEYLEFEKQDRKTLEKINKLVRDIERNGVAEGLGKPEALKHQYSGYWSRRIDEKNRLIYEVNEQNQLHIIACKGHYN